MYQKKVVGREKDLEEELEQQGQVQRLTKTKSNFRYTIRVLQEIPIVLSLAVLANYFLDLFDIDISLYEYPVFGFSFYIMIRLYLAARRLYVSYWSLVLYIMLLLLMVFEFADNVCGISENVIYLQEIVEITFVVGVISSLVTFIYWKFKHGR